ncbi:hypothetical protein Tco_0117712 [Tanacetum coccineum]
MKLCYNTFKFKEGETLTQTFTRYNALMNELVNDGIKLSKLEINTGFINGLPKKWLSFCQSLRNTNHVKDSKLASLFGKLKYEENLIDNIYETEEEKTLVSATLLSTAFFSTSIVQDFQDSHDDEEDTRSSQEYLNDLEEEYQARVLLAKSKRPLPNESSSSTPGISPDVAALTTEVSEIKNMMKTMLIDNQKAQARMPIKAVEQSCVTCGVSKPVVAPVSTSMPNPKPSIPYPLRQNDEKRRENANEQKEKFYEIFKDMSFEISFMDALTLMPKFTSTLKALIGNKEKLSEMARTSLNEHCSAVILNITRKTCNPGRFHIHVNFPRMMCA